MNAQQLLALAEKRRWREVSTLVARPENRWFLGELLPLLEASGDRAAVAERWLDAGNLYQMAVLCGTAQMYSGASRGDPRAMQEPILRLSGKLKDALERVAGERARDEAAPVDWESGTARAIELARQQRWDEGAAMLRRVGAPDGAGRRLEEEAGRSRGALRKWLLERAVEQFESAGDRADADQVKAVLAPPPPPRAPKPIEKPKPAVDFEALVERLADLARERKRSEWVWLVLDRKHKDLAPRIAEHFERLGDKQFDGGEWRAAEEFYSVAHAAGATVALAQKIDRAVLAGVDAKLDAPVSDADAGLERAESLALAGRFGEAEEWLEKLEAVRDGDPLRGYELPGRYEAIGNYLLEHHPEQARWFYERFEEAAAALPADTAAEGYAREGIVATARQKVAEAQARLPRRVARIEAVLSALGQGPRPEPEAYAYEVEDGGRLRLTPERDLFMTCSDEHGLPMRTPPEWLPRYSFRLQVEGREARLVQEVDQYGRAQPFGLDTEFPGRTRLRLKLGRPVKITCNLPGGGPQWTLTLASIAMESASKL